MSFKPVFSCITEVARLPRTLRVGYSREERRGRPYTGFTVEQHSRFLKGEHP